MLQKFQAWRTRRMSRTVYKQYIKNVKGSDIQNYMLFGKLKKTDRILRRLSQMVRRRSKIYASHPVETWGMTMEEFHGLFMQLLQFGGGRWVRGFFPPVASFCSESTLCFLLRNKQNILQDEKLRDYAVQMLLTYFAGIYTLPTVDMKEALADPLSALDTAIKELQEMVI